MRLILLFSAVISLYASSEFSIDKAAYPSEFSIDKNFTNDHSKHIYKSVKQISSSRNTDTPDHETKNTPKPILTGYEHVRQIFGEKVIQVNSKQEAKNLIKKRKDLIPYIKRSSIVITDNLNSYFKASDLIIMIPQQQRADEQIMYSIYFLKKEQ